MVKLNRYRKLRSDHRPTRQNTGAVVAAPVPQNEMSRHAMSWASVVAPT